MSFFSLSEKFNFLILRLNKNKKFFLKDYEIGINLGSEDNTIKEYAGIDGSFLIYLGRSHLPNFLKKIIYNKSCTADHRSFSQFLKSIKEKRIIHHNLSYGIPFHSNSIGHIYTSHFIEHLNGNDAVKLLRECYRCLKKGGILRIVVPPIENEIERMRESTKKYEQNKDSKPIQEFIAFAEKNRNHFSFHRRMYSYKDLEKILQNTGFKKIFKRKFKEGNMPKTKEIEVRDGLIIEAIK
ncbi:MAG: methyltransferase domain-containing protein [Nanoarchaeota archaeon]|nr:methyltransferase domain-containing protein [Nanoarchaeota archaeon]